MPTQGLAPCEHNMYGFTDRAATTYGFMSAYLYINSQFSIILQPVTELNCSFRIENPTY